MRGTLRAASRLGLAVALCVAIVGLRGHVASAAGQAPQPAQNAQQPAQNSQQPAQSAQPPATNSQETPTFRSGVNFVRVDVIATDKTGAIVPNLKAEDFEISEQGKPQKIEAFKLVSLDGGLMAATDMPPQPIRSDEDEQREAAKDDVRLFSIFLDDYHVKRDSSLGARRQIAQFIDTQLGPSDMVGVMYPLQPISSVLMTRNHDAIKRGIEQFVGRKFDYRPINAMEEQYAHYPTEVVEGIRNDVSMTALRALIIHMGGLKEGRKALILISEGYSAYLPPQLRDADSQNPGSGNPNRLNPSAGASGTDVNENRAQNSADADMQMRLRDIYEEANHYNVSIYAVDPRMLATGEFGVDMPAIDERLDRQYLNSTMDTLRTLSEETDGRAIVNTNNLTLGMKQIVRDTSAYYLLGYNSTFTVPDGKFHEIKVRLKKPGVEIRARKGYWALNREELAAVTAPRKVEAPSPVQAALTAATSSIRERVVRTWLGTEKGEGGKTKITFVWEPAPKVAGDTSRPGDQPARVSVMAAGGDGTPYFRGRVPEAPAVAPASGTGGSVTFEVPPGSIELRLSVEGSASNVLDSEVRTLAVPDLTAPQTTLSTPEIFRARTPRDMQLIKTDPHAVPVVGRDFTRTDRLLVRVAAYGPGSTPPKLSAKLLNRAGQSMVELPVPAAPTADEPSQFELPLAGLVAGDYVIEIDAAGDGGPAQELIGFRITG
jgi:VWFA-related protein